VIAERSAPAKTKPPYLGFTILRDRGIPGCRYPGIRENCFQFDEFLDGKNRNIREDRLYLEISETSLLTIITLVETIAACDCREHPAKPLPHFRPICILCAQSTQV
jgi:hypothetical protein